MTKEFDDLDKIYAVWAKEPGQTNFGDIEILNSRYKAFISQHFLPKSEVDKMIKEAKEEEHQFFLNILNGIDITDKQMGNTGGGTEAIRLALKSRII